MAFGVQVRRFAALALGQVALGDARPSIVDPTAGTGSIDAWLDTLEALARKGVEQRISWEAEARLRHAIRAKPHR